MAKKPDRENRQHLRGDDYVDHMADVAYTLTHIPEVLGITCARSLCGDVIIPGLGVEGEWGAMYCSTWCRACEEGGDY